MSVSSKFDIAKEWVKDKLSEHGLVTERVVQRWDAKRAEREEYARYPNTPPKEYMERYLSRNPSGRRDIVESRDGKHPTATWLHELSANPGWIHDRIRDAGLNPNKPIESIDKLVKSYNAEKERIKAYERAIKEYPEMQVMASDNGLRKALNSASNLKAMDDKRSRWNSAAKAVLRGTAPKKERDAGYDIEI